MRPCAGTTSKRLASVAEMGKDALTARSNGAGLPQDDSAAAKPSAIRVRNRLFIKYVGLFVTVVVLALASSGMFDVYFYYREHKASLIRIQREQARGGGGQDRPVHQGDREPARLDHAAAVVGRLDRAAPVRRAAAAAPGAGDHRAGAARRDRQGAAARLAARHGRGRQRDRLLQGAEVHRGGGQQGLLRPGLFPPRIRALHDAGDRRHAARCRRERRGGQSQADLGRGLADQGRRARPCLCGRRAGPPDRASRTSAWCCATPTCRSSRRCARARRRRSASRSRRPRTSRAARC